MSAAKRLDNFTGMSGLDDLALSTRMYNNFAALIYDIAGVHLPDTPKNQALVRNRIVKVLRKNDYKTYEEYWTLLEQGNEKILSEFISALTTNMTSFYREPSHFEFLAEILPSIEKNFGNDIRLWCAAASTGQEPYTIAFTTEEVHFSSPKTKVRILATDIDLQVLNKASIGIYEEREIEGLDTSKRNKYFDKVKKEKEQAWRVKQEINSLIRFAPFNLMNQKYDFKFQFHIIFCRNVLIYFDEPTKKKVIDNLVSSLIQGGYLVLGHSESGNIKHPHLSPLSRAVYQKI